MLKFFSDWWDGSTPRNHVMGFYEAMKPLHDANCKQWFYNLSMLRGRQWMAYYGNTDVLKEMAVPSWRVKAVFNKILPLATIQRHKILPNDPTITVRPANTNSEKDKQNADLARQFLKAIWKSKNFNKTLNKFSSWMVSCTVGYILPLWDGRAGDELDEGVYTGDICIEPASPFEIIPDYTADDFDTIHRFIRIKPRSVDYIQHKYGVKVDPEKLSVNDIYQLRAQALAAGSADYSKVIENFAMTYEMFELPSKKFPTGFHHICTAKNDLIQQEDLTCYYKICGKKKEWFLPLEAAQMIELPGMLIGTNSVEQAIPAQCYYNQGKSTILENAKRLGRPKIIAPKGKISRGAMIDDPAEIIVETDPDVQGEVVPLKPPEMANYHLENIRSMVPEMQDAFGVHDASQGILPRRATSGKAIQFLIGQDDERAQDPKKGVDRAIEGAFNKILAIAANCYSELRTKDLIGDDNNVITRELKGEDLRAADVTIVRDTTLPKSSAERMDLATAVLEKNPSREQVEIMFAIMQADSVEELKHILQGSSEAEETYARMENYDMRKRLERPASIEENHELHQKIHDIALRDPGTSPEAKLMIANHKMEHQRLNGLKNSMTVEAEPGAAPQIPEGEMPMPEEIPPGQ